MQVRQAGAKTQAAMHVTGIFIFIIKRVPSHNHSRLVLATNTLIANSISLRVSLLHDCRLCSVAPENFHLLLMPEQNNQGTHPHTPRPRTDKKTRIAKLHHHQRLRAPPPPAKSPVEIV
jgi:hypothetical protein